MRLINHYHSWGIFSSWQIDIYVSYFSQKTRFDTSCKLSLLREHLHEMSKPTELWKYSTEIGLFTESGECLQINVNFTEWTYTYRIWPNYCTHPYMRTVKQFRSLQITTRVLLYLYLYFFIKAMLLVHIRTALTSRGNSNEHLQHYAFVKKIRKNIALTPSNTPFMKSFANLTLKCGLICWIFYYNCFQ